MADWQGSYNGLTFGVGTAYRMAQVEGLDAADVRDGSTDRARAHGQHPGSTYLGGRAVRIEFVITSNDPDTTHTAFNRAMVTGLTDLPLGLEVPGVAGGRPVQLTGRVAKRGLVQTRDVSVAQVARPVVQFWCTDPLIYDATETVLSTTVADTSGIGEAWPFVWPIDWGGSSSGGTVTAVNAGDFWAPWSATLYGPLVSPRIETTDAVLRFDGSLAAGQTLTIDSRTQGVFLDGVSRYGWLRTQSQWFELPPGSTVVRLAASSGAGSMSFRFRSAWA
jgi:hypothetical protein